MTTPRHRIFVGQDPHKFHAAHMTVRPDGTKERLHGHTYHVRVAVELAELSFQRFLDLGVLKDALEALCREWNERLLLPDKNPHFAVVRESGGELEFTLCGKRYVVPADEATRLPLDNVVVETLAAELAERLQGRLQAELERAGAVGLEVEVTEVRGQGGMAYREL